MYANRWKILVISIIMIIFQLFIPVINISGIEFSPDLLIIFLTYIGYYYGRLEAIILGFLFGIIQDFATQFELIGVMSFIKSLIGYCLGTMALYRDIWHRNFRLLIIFSSYLFHFIIFQSISMNSTAAPEHLFIKIILIQSILCFFILIVFDKSIMRNGILK
jgi:rod shape-determining protein MreD